MRTHRPALALLALAACAALALAVPWRSADPLPGPYVNVTNGGPCAVARVGPDYVFTNEKGDPARFRFVGPDRLAYVSGRGWDPNIVATVGTNRRGRTTIRFEAPWTAPGLWVAAD